MQAVHAVVGEVLKLAARIFDAGGTQAVRIVFKRASSLITGEGSEAPHMNTMRLICCFPMKGMIPAVMGTVMPAESASSRKR